MSSPIFSIIIPTYNRGYIISKTIDSIVGQTYLDWECIVVDDGSIDNTELLIEEYRQKDDRIIWLKNYRKKGAPGARNTGLYHAKGNWVLFFDSDNEMRPLLLETIFHNLKNEYDVYTCYSDVLQYGTDYVINNFRWNCFGIIRKGLLSGECYVDNNSAVIKKELLLKYGGFDEDCPSMQEWDLHLRLSQEAHYYTIKQSLVKYYVGGTDAISTNKIREVDGRLFILNKYRSLWYADMSASVGYVHQIEEFICRIGDRKKQLFYKIKLYLIAPKIQLFRLKKKVSSYI